MMHLQTDEAVLNNFETNLQLLLTKHGLSHEELSKRAGLADDASVATLLSGSTLPDISVPVRLAQAFDVPVEALLKDPKEHLVSDFEVLPLQDVDRHAANLLSAVFKATEKSLDHFSDRPTMDSIIAWWKETGGDLAQCEQLSPHFDVVEAAHDAHGIPEVQHMGALGLSATTLRSRESQRLKDFLSSLNDSDLVELNTHIRTVTRSGVGMISPQTRIVELPEYGETVEVSFVRLMLPVTDAFGQPFVLNYSTLLSESTPKRQDGCSLKN